MDQQQNRPIRPTRVALPHDPPPWVTPGSVFFVTVCGVPRSENQLCHPPAAAAIFESVEFRQQRGDWFAHLVVLMPDHLHLLASFPRDVAMRKLVAGWKEIIAKRIGIRWQRDFFDHRLRSDAEFEAKAHYIRMNPVRAGLVASPEDWPFVWERGAGPVR